jgi:hypothetical protein
VSTWAAPAHLPEGYLLKPSIHQCQQRLHWVPDIVVGDLAYIRQDIKKEIRLRWRVAVVTKMKPDMNIIDDQHHWFGPRAGRQLCGECWEASHCPKEFSYPASLHETLFGLLPLNTAAANRILNQVRSWIEPAQAYEKNLLGLKWMFLNSLRLCWMVSLLADAVVLLRALALLAEPEPTSDLLNALRPQQMTWDFPNQP